MSASAAGWLGVGDSVLACVQNTAADRRSASSLIVPEQRHLINTDLKPWMDLAIGFDYCLLCVNGCLSVHLKSQVWHVPNIGWDAAIGPQLPCWLPGYTALSFFQLRSLQNSSWK